MKILLVTLKGNFNWGNKLQNYALQTMLEKLGAEVTNLDYWREENLLWRALRCVKHLLCDKDIKIQRRKRRREYRIAQWSKQNLHRTIKISYKGAFLRDWQEYEGAVTGSDQVWHRWYEDENELPYFYLEFVKEEKRIAYAPSFGFEEFPEVDKEMHRHGLQGMRFLSCREAKGTQLIKELTGQEATTVLDPTLLLSKAEWETCACKPSFSVPEEYILVYFLGGISIEQKAEIQKLQQCYACQIVNMYSVLEEAYTSTPFEFIWLIQHARCVCTDSFHTTVFSLLFEREIKTFNRTGNGFDKMYFRITELKELWENPVRLRERREASERYLREALGRLQ